MKPIYTFSEQNTELFMAQAGGMYDNHSALEG